MTVVRTPEIQLTSTITLVRPIGHGGMASVWLARHEALGAEVAVKILSGKLLYKHPNVVERLKREAAICARIDSPHIVRVFDLGKTSEGLPYIVMELLKGETLDDRLDRRELLSLQDTASLIRQVGEVLGQSHALGAIHRDIKPANLFVLDTPELFVKVLDFGLVKNLHSSPELTTTGLVVGSPRYMSPEQFLGSPDIDGRADLWSLGVAAYRALTRRYPFDHSEALAVAHAVLKGNFRPPSELNAGLPPAVDAFFKRAFQRRVEKRFQTAEEMTKAFDVAVKPPRKPLPTQVLSDPIPVVVEPYSPPVESSQWRRGSMVAATSALLAFATVLAVESEPPVVVASHGAMAVSAEVPPPPPIQTSVKSRPTTRPKKVERPKPAPRATKPRPFKSPRRRPKPKPIEKDYGF